MKTGASLQNSTALNAELGNRIIKVNHAGEQGAINIYTGQMLMAKFTAPDLVEELREFRSHEIRHRAVFQGELTRRNHPRCRSYHLCGLGGLVLGLITGLCGRNAIAATTVAVERVVLKHLQQQISVLEGHDSMAADAIRLIVDEEQQHHDQSVSYMNHDSFWRTLLDPIVSTSTEAVIWLGMRL